MTTFVPTTPPLTSRKAYAPGVNVRVRQGHTDNIVPANFSELFEHYYGYAVRLVASNGINPDDAEDVAMTILSHFFRRDSLNHYDPEFTTENGGVKRTIPFASFFSGFVMSYLRHHQTMQWKKHQREPMSIDEIMVERDDVESEDVMLSIVETNGPRDVTAERIDYIYAVHDMQARLGEVQPRSDHDKFNALSFFEAVRWQVEQLGAVSTQALAAHFSVAPSTIQNWMARLRTELS